eukprot:GFUD01044404.1.p1 GENE.GFUD01044404.1~~GFUD01044404.1.p1  ORF type:complete len:271 (-),score=38.91 GFUD01044404.1:148-960(-)
MACSDNVSMPPGTLPCLSHYMMVMFVHANVACVLSGMKNTVTIISPVVGVGVNSVKAVMKKFGITSLSEEVMKKIESNVNTAVFSISAAVEKISSLSQLAVAWKISPLRTSAIGLFLGTVQDKATGYGVSTIGYMASFSLAQVVLKVAADAGLHVFGQTLWITGVSDRAWRRIRRFHIATSTIPLWSSIMARTDIRKKKELSTIGIVVKVLKEFLSLMLLRMIQLVALIMWVMKQWWRWLVLRRIEIAVTCQVALNTVLLLEKFVLVQHK